MLLEQPGETTWSGRGQVEPSSEPPSRPLTDCNVAAGGLVEDCLNRYGCHLGAPITIASLDPLVRTGVYFLYRDGVVVYVGQAVDVRRRVGQHIGEGVKRFDAVSAVACAVRQLDRLESYFIRKFVPEYNVCSIARAMRANGALAADVPDRPPCEQFLDTGAAADFLGVPKQLLLDLRRKRKGPRSMRVPRTKRTVYRPSDLLAFRDAAGDDLVRLAAIYARRISERSAKGG